MLSLTLLELVFSSPPLLELFSLVACSAVLLLLTSRPLFLSGLRKPNRSRLDCLGLSVGLPWSNDCRPVFPGPG
jgi:hypothetical protein